MTWMQRHSSRLEEMLRNARRHQGERVYAWQHFEYVYSYFVVVSIWRGHMFVLPSLWECSGNLFEKLFATIFKSTQTCANICWSSFKKYMYSRGEVYTMHIYCGLSVVQHEYVWSYSSDRVCLAYVLGSTHWLNCGFALMIKNTLYNKVLRVIGTVTTCMISVISVENVCEFQVKCVRPLIMQCCFDYLFQWIFCKKTKLKRFGAEVVTAAWNKSAGCRRQSKSGGAKKENCFFVFFLFLLFISSCLAARDWKELQTSCEQF